MFRRVICTPSILLVLLAVASLSAPAQQQTASLEVRGYSGEAGIVRVNGRPFVDLEALVRITGGSVSFEGGRAVLTLPSGEAGAEPANLAPAGPGFSRPFMSAGIEALASMREWGSTLVVAIRNGFPIGSSLNPYRGRAADQVRLAATAVSSDDDRRGMELLKREFDGVQAWSDKLVNARNTMSAANYTMSEDALQRDPMFQDIVQCGQFLAQMFAGGSFQESAACH